MAPSTPKLLVSVDLKKKPREQVPPLHNRWHPEIPPVAEVETGQLFRVEMIDWTGGAVQDNNCAIDVKTLNLSTVSINLKLQIVHGQDISNSLWLNQIVYINEKTMQLDTFLVFFSSYSECRKFIIHLMKGAPDI